VLSWGLAMTDLEREIRHLVSRFVAGQSTFPDFDAAFARTTWDVPASDPGAQRLTYDVELPIAEFTSAHRTEQELRRELSRVLGDVLDVEMRPVSAVYRLIATGRPGVILWDAPVNRHWATWSRTSASNVVRREAVSA